MRKLNFPPSIIASLLTLTILVAGCARGPISLRFGSDDPETNSGNGGIGEQKLEDLISWEEISQKVFLNPNVGNCNECHDNGDSPNLTNYNEFKLNLQSVKEEVIVTRKMPRKRTLTDEQYNLVKLWIEQGAPEKGRPFSP